MDPSNGYKNWNPALKSYPSHGVIGTSTPGWCDLGALHRRHLRANQQSESGLMFRRRKLELEKLDEDGCNSTLCRGDHSKSELSIPDFNEGKKTSEMYPVSSKLSIPERFENPGVMFKGYGLERNQHPFYATTSSQYGRLPPNVHTVPTRYYPIRSELQEYAAVSGGNRNRSLNVK